MSDDTAYKILSGDEYAVFQRDGVFTGSAADKADGYIHLSTGSQLSSTVERYYRDRADLVLAAVDLTKLGDTVRWEAASNGAFYPHIYGALPMAAVVAASPLQRGADGRVTVPG